MGFYVRAVCEILVKNLWRSGFRDLLATDTQLLTRETRYMRSTCWNLKSPWHARFREWLVTQAKSRVTCETHFLLFFECDFSHSLPTLYIPSLPTKCKKEYLQETFEKETLAKHLRVRDCFTHNPLHHFSKISIYSHLSIYISLRGS